MLRELRKFLKRGRRSDDACTDLLGSSANVSKFSQFWLDHGDDLMLVSAVRLHEYTGGDNLFTKEELAAYKKGVADIALFFQACSQEIAKKKAAIEEAQKAV